MLCYGTSYMSKNHKYNMWLTENVLVYCVCKKKQDIISII